MGREAFAIPFHLLIQTFSGNAIEFCKIFIQHDALVAQDVDCSFNSFYWDHVAFCHAQFCTAPPMTSLGLELWRAA